jgi:2-polyprenyl-3-methyl-5-hydroxy-6-metoxy-1,4-benzoquinol methylase
MTIGNDETKAAETSVRQCYSTWGESYYRDYYTSASAYPPVHVNIVRKQLAAARPGRLLDAGCGPASMLRDLDGLGIDRYGFDLTPEMVAEAKRVMAAQGVANNNIWEGSVLDHEAFIAPDKVAFDACLCFGVLPHIPLGLEGRVLTNLGCAVRKGGLVMVEARNQLFSMFSLNRYSRDFFMESLIDLSALEMAADTDQTSRLEEARATIERHFRMDLPQIRKGKSGEPGYDEVLSHTHNPFELRQIAERAGLRDVSILFYHYHCMPPMVEHLFPDLFRKVSLSMEDPMDWRGYFMASAFILSGYKG